jgi:putative acyl-CoA dehydrogenase
MTIDAQDRAGRRRTHEVDNQVPPLTDWNPFLRDVALGEALEREGAGWARDMVAQHGARAGSAEVESWGFLANHELPALRTHDRYGRRIDEVAFHPAWHALMAWSIGGAVHSLAWTNARDGAWAARSAMYLLSASVDAGHGCPVSMATSCVSALRAAPSVAEVWVPRVNATAYDPRSLPAGEKRGCLVGMAMTEKQGGSDVRSNTTTAEPVGARGVGELYTLTGHKWFVSAPMCDAFLTLAQARPDGSGLSCFLLPRILPDGTRNGFHLQRLKDKLGNRSNASAEVEYDGALAWLVGEEGRGVPTIIEMVNHTRRDVALISTAMMRLAVAHAVHHARHRRAFQKPLIEHVLMQNVLADLCLESEAATALMMRVAGAFDREGRSSGEKLLRRLYTAVGKYWICKRAPAHLCEAMECIGGNGFTEEFVFPRLYREAPLNAIWEGSGNVICLDVHRALTRAPETVDALFDDLRPARGGSAHLDAAMRALEADLRGGAGEVGDGRRLAERIALTVQAALLVQHAPPEVADAFCASRLGGESGVAFGTLPRGLDHRFIIERALPPVS